MMNISDFEWESEEQRKGTLALVKWLHEKAPGATPSPSDLFFIQKDHESHQWWTETIACQIGMLQSEIVLLRQQVLELSREIKILKSRSVEMARYTP